MNVESVTQSQTESAEAFYSRIFRRLMLLMVIFAVALTPVAWTRFGTRIGLSFAAGSLIALLNFYWLALTIRAAGKKAEESGGRSGRAGVMLRFFFRYLLIALAAYVIFNSSAESLYGLFAGLSLPVVAILIEAVLEVYSALRAGI
ncbi:MAG TPA: ATP synthase subunit I [Candidatus Acidoferrales bacterium]|nr:ATP synthase subunit I [Candidatus Acidoferrales bacterium]